MKWLNRKQIEFAFKTRAFKEARWLPLFATKRWAFMIAHWPEGKDNGPSND